MRCMRLGWGAPVAPVAAVCVLLGWASAASAQVFYQPVKYQHSAGGRTYYYAGNDPAIHAYARTPRSPGGTWGRVNGFAFQSGDLIRHREVTDEPSRIFSDAAPFQNLRPWGYTVADVANDANAAVPRYWRKRDLLAAAQRVEGQWIVPADAQPVRTEPIHMSAPTTEIQPRAVIIPAGRASDPATIQKVGWVE